MKILVTGANGFLANNIIRELLSRDHEIIAFIKTGEDISTISDLKLDIRYGNILDYDSVLSASRGCNALIHAAADTSTYPSRSEIQRRVNVEGTLNVMNAALENRVTRVIHIGSANSFGFGTRENPGDENSPYSCARYGLGYMDTKREAQDLVMELVRTLNLPAVVLNPTFMLGRFCVASGSGQMLLAIKEKKTPGYAKGGRNFVYVRDVAVAAANALTMGRIGECYILGNENLNYREAFGLMAEAAGVTPPRLYIPGFAAMAFGLLLETAGKLFRFRPALTYSLAKISNDGNYYSSVKAVKELKLPQTPVATAIRESFDWLENKN